MSTAAPNLEEILVLDALCLTDPAGGPLDLAAHRQRLTVAMKRARFASVRRGDSLVAYGYIWPMQDDDWFVGGFSIHPDHRNAGVTSGLFAAFAHLVAQAGVARLHSHVLKSNASSLRLHRRLGFQVAQENERAVAFAVQVEDLSGLRALHRGR